MDLRERVRDARDWEWGWIIGACVFVVLFIGGSYLLVSYINAKDVEESRQNRATCTEQLNGTLVEWGDGWVQCMVNGAKVKSWWEED